MVAKGTGYSSTSQRGLTSFWASLWWIDLLLSERWSVVVIWTPRLSTFQPLWLLETPFLAPLASLLEVTYQKSIREPDQTLPTPLMPLPPRKIWVIVVSSWPLVAQLDMAPQTAAIQSEDGDKHVNIFSVDIEIPICVSSIWITNFFLLFYWSHFFPQIMDMQSWIIFGYPPALSLCGKISTHLILRQFCIFLQAFARTQLNCPFFF